MLTKLVLKVSLFATFVTFVYCMLMNLPVLTSLSRAFTVFGGFYFILIAFFISLRMIFNPGTEEDETNSESSGHLPTTEHDERDFGHHTAVENTGVVSEQ